MSTDTDPYAPDPKASQRVARANRARQHDETDADERTPDADPGRYQIVAGVIGLLTVLGVFALALSQFSTSGPIKIAPTTAPTRAVFAPPVLPTITPEPQATPVPPPTPTAVLLAAPVVAPQTGRGMPAAQPEVAPEVVPEVSQYILNVGAQAPHVPRGGHCGPTGGDCALGVPPGLDVSAYIANVGAQKPHKVR